MFSRLVVSGAIYPPTFRPGKQYPLKQGTFFYHFRQWQRRGRWFKVHEALRKAARKKAGRHPHASAAVLDSQSIKTTAEGAHFRGFDGNKKVKGRKRHVLVDTLGLLLSVYTTPANTR